MQGYIVHSHCFPDAPGTVSWPARSRKSPRCRTCETWTCCHNTTQHWTLHKISWPTMEQLNSGTGHWTISADGNDTTTTFHRWNHWESDREHWTPQKISWWRHWQSGSTMEQLTEGRHLARSPRLSHSAAYRLSSAASTRTPPPTVLSTSSLRPEKRKILFTSLY